MVKFGTVIQLNFSRTMINIDSQLPNYGTYYSVFEIGFDAPKPYPLSVKEEGGLY